MKINVFTVLLAVTPYFFCLADEVPGGSEYASEIESYRSSFFDPFLDKEYSPIRTDADLSRIRYYKPDSHYRVEGTFEIATDENPVKMVTTTGGNAPFVRYAWIKFEQGGANHKIAVYKRVYDGPDFFFIPFKDLTNGKSTYGGGRYLGFKMEAVKDNRVWLDFNKAYNPWCHYDENLACPLAPDENSLTIAIHAGEKKYAKAAD